MNNLFASQHPKHSCRRVLSTLLLALPLAGIAFQLPSAQAQPAPTQPAKKSPLSPEQKAAVSRLLAISRLGNLCKIPVDLKVENATLEDVMARVKEMLPGQVLEVEVRGATPVRVGFDLKGAKVGDVLDHVAGLAGCRLWVLGDGLLIAPQTLLSTTESLDVKRRYQGGEWRKSDASGAPGWSITRGQSELFTRAIAEEATGSSAKILPAGVLKMTFGSFSPEAQEMLQELSGWSAAGARRPPFNLSVHLNADSLVTVDTSKPRAVDITFGHGTSDSSNAPTWGVQHIIIGAEANR